MFEPYTITVLATKNLNIIPLLNEPYDYYNHFFVEQVF